MKALEMLPRMRSRQSSVQRVTETTNAIMLNGRRLEAAYRIELDETSSSVRQESLPVGGKPIDSSRGRVFVIDLTQDSPS